MKKLIITIILIVLPNLAHATISIPTDFLAINSGLVGWWTMDGKNTDWNMNITRDLSASGNTGIIMNMSTSTGPVPGKIGQGLLFDGVNDYIQLATTNSLDNLSAMSISVWIKPDSFAGCANFNAAIVERQNTNHGWHLACNSSRYIRFASYTGDSGGTTMIITTTDTIKTGVWTHIAFSWDGNVNGSNAFMYVNGKLSTTLTQVGTGTRNNDATLPFHIGYGQYNTAYHNGVIDDVRIYSRAISATEIAQLYTATAGSKGAVSLVGPGNLDSGLVGWWTMDGKDTNWNTNTTGDLSGNGNTGMMRNMSTSTSPVPGKVGQGLRFDGNDDSINLGSGSSLDDIETQGGGGMTVAFWINPDSNANKVIMEKGPGSSGTGFWHISKTSNTNPARMTFAKEGATDSSKNYNSLLNTGAWNHIVLTWDGSMTFSTGVQVYKNGVLIVNTGGTDGSSANSDASQSICLGNVYVVASDSCAASNNLDASLDDVRMYNRILSATEIAQLYTATAGSKGAVSLVGPGNLDSGLVGWWTMDGKHMYQNVTDSSGYGNHGNLKGQTSTTTAIGVIGQALSFDGSDDHVIINQNPISGYPFTKSIWLKAPSVSGQTSAISYADTASNVVYYSLGVNGNIPTQKLYVALRSSVPDEVGFAGITNLVPGKWYLATLVMNSATDHGLYLNGNLEVTNTVSIPFVAGNNISIGVTNRGAPFGYWKGLVDDARVYDRALSAPEITQLYNAGRR